MITDVLGIFEFFLENSCKEQGNYFNISGAEPKGGTFSQIIEAKNEIWDDYPGTGEDALTGPSTTPRCSATKRRPLRLNPVGALTPGLADNACIDCSANNIVEMSWAGYNPCPEGLQLRRRTTGDADRLQRRRRTELRQPATKRCPFPAAGLPEQAETGLPRARATANC